jgi:hypothetical protein
MPAKAWNPWARRPPWLDESATLLRLVGGLPGYLRHRLDPAGVRNRIVERQANRTANFLDAVRRGVYQVQGSPYRALLEWAGIGFDDLAALTAAEGVEGALLRLREAGVFVTTEEFKGKCAIRRGSLVVGSTDRSFDNPLAQGHLFARSGGSRSPGLRTVYDLRNLAANWSEHIVLRLSCYGLLEAPIGVWYPIMPGAGPVVVLALAKAGIFPRWFTPLGYGRIPANWRSLFGTLIVVYWGRIYARRLPKPQFVPADDPTPILGWIQNCLSRKGRCALFTYASHALRLSRCARDCGLDLDRMVFLVSSEPLTPVRRREIEASGAAVYPSYATMETGVLAAGCVSPVEADEMHLLTDTVAVVVYPRQTTSGGEPIPTVLTTGLQDSFPKVLLNAETGDSAQVFERSCGCPLEDLGFRHRVHAVYGFDKLSPAGMTFLAADLVRLLEQELPARFGGSSLDYQLQEIEDEGGRSRLNLLVSPRLGPLDPAALVEVVLQELGRGTDSRRLMAQIWSDQAVIQVVREEPRLTARGKHLSLDLRRPPEKTAH